MRKILLSFLILILFTISIKTSFGQTPPADSAKIKLYQAQIDVYTKKINSDLADSLKAEWYVLRGGTEVSMRQLDKAISDYTMALSIKPGMTYMYLSRASCYFLAKKNQLAIDDYEIALKYSKNDPEKCNDIYNNIALSQKRLKNYDKAVEAYSKALLLPSNSATCWSHFGRGDIYSLLKQYQKAIDDYSVAMSSFGDKNLILSSLYSDRGNMKRFLQKFNEAIEDFSKALELNPDKRLAYWNKAATYYENGDFELAIPLYNEAISRYHNDNSSLADLYKERATMERGLQQYQKGVEDDSAAILLNTKDWETHFDRGKVYWKKDKKLALADFDQVILLDTTKKSLEYAFAWYYRGNSSKAIKIMKDKLASDTESYDLMQDCYNLASIYSLVNKPIEANAYLQRCMDYGYRYAKRCAIIDDDFENIRNTKSFKEIVSTPTSKR